jgi:hypothetical protein
MKRCYYAHVMALYDTPQEKRDLELIRRLGFEPVNPNNQTTYDRCKQLRAQGRGGDIMEDIFKPIIQGDCDVLAFRALPGGDISSGVVKEINYARDAGLPVIELPWGLCYFDAIESPRAMGIEETRAYLKEVGQR